MKMVSNKRVDVKKILDGVSRFHTGLLKAAFREPRFKKRIAAYLFEGLFLDSKLNEEGDLQYQIPNKEIEGLLEDEIIGSELRKLFEDSPKVMGELAMNIVQGLLKTDEERCLWSQRIVKKALKNSTLRAKISEIFMAEINF